VQKVLALHTTGKEACNKMLTFKDEILSTVIIRENL
jgi:hypothetical protein